MSNITSKTHVITLNLKLSFTEMHGIIKLAVGLCCKIQTHMMVYRLRSKSRHSSLSGWMDDSSQLNGPPELSAEKSLWYPTGRRSWGLQIWPKTKVAVTLNVAPLYQIQSQSSA
jgi:hypothetical protein